MSEKAQQTCSNSKPEHCGYICELKNPEIIYLPIVLRAYLQNTESRSNEDKGRAESVITKQFSENTHWLTTHSDFRSTAQLQTAQRLPTNPEDPKLRAHTALGEPQTSLMASPRAAGQAEQTGTLSRSLRQL